jgi:hypothetical protein
VAWIPPKELPHLEWVAAGQRLGATVGCNQWWWLGDWLRYGISRWGERYVEAARITGYDPESLRIVAWLSSEFDLSRRRDKLSWSHHAAVASLDRDQQEYWLDRAAGLTLSVADLRLELRAARRCGCAATKELSSSNRPTALVCPNCGDPVPIPAGLVRSDASPERSVLFRARLAGSAGPLASLLGSRRLLGIDSSVANGRRILWDRHIWTP